MDDLVARLRAEDPECGLRHSIAMEAADRIEQLESALKVIQCDCTVLCGATEHTEKPDGDCLHFLARQTLAGGAKDA